MLLVKTLKCMFLIKNLRVYTIGKSSAVFSLRGPLCATFPYMPSRVCNDISVANGRQVLNIIMIDELLSQVQSE